MENQSNTWQVIGRVIGVQQAWGQKQNFGGPWGLAGPWGTSALHLTRKDHLVWPFHAHIPPGKLDAGLEMSLSEEPLAPLALPREPPKLFH